MHKNLFVTYASSMSRHGYGYALYEPASSTIVKPGVCGYLDENGCWNPIADLTDEISLKEKGLGLIGNLERIPDSVRSWGPKISESVKSKRYDLKAGLSSRAPGIPAEAAVQYEYSTSQDFGAILLCSETVTREGFYHRAVFSKWAKENAQTILHQYPDVEKHGFFVVTTTFSTPTVSLNAWTDADNKIVIGFKTTFVDAFEIAPSSEWYTADLVNGWIHCKAEKKDERKVVFFGGVKFRYRKWTANRLVKEIPQNEWTRFRSGKEEASFTIHDPDHGSYEVDFICIGDDFKEDEDED